MASNGRWPSVAVFVSSVLLQTALLAQRPPFTVQSGPAPADAGGGEIAPPGDHLTDRQRRDIQASIDRSVADLTRRGTLAPPAAALVPLGWPLRPDTVLADYGYHGMSAFVDHDLAFPNLLRDYQCGRRTYDTSGGNHTGTDFFTWPFGWLKMDNSLVHIVAAAPGTIVGKLDGYSDRSCAMSGSSWNAVYVRHADGSVAWYGHMKRGSTTAKGVGTSVVAGEYLGTVGSSGSSTGADTSVAAPATTWYLAEGATHSGFDLFYLVQNPNALAAAVNVTYLLPAPAAPIVKTYAVPANSRFNIWVNKEGALLASTDVSAIVTSTNGVPVIVERAMYLNAGGLTFGAGHESAGVTAPATTWFLAEGATGPYFDLFVLVANPGATAATIRATFLLPSGATVVRDYVVPATSRFNIWVDTVDPQLGNTAVSTTIASTNGVAVIAERAMWWPGTAATWQEAHNSPGSTVTGTRWALAEGEVGGSRNAATYVLIANTSAFAGSASVTLLFEDGTSAAKTFPLNANGRFSVDVAAEFASAAGRTFGAVVESLGPTPAQIVVERAMYSNAGGVAWAAGTNALATRLP